MPKYKSKVDEALDETFPASDAPAWTSAIPGDIVENEEAACGPYCECEAHLKRLKRAVQ